MPGFLEIDPLMLPTEMYRKDAGNDMLMAQFYDQNRIPVTFDQVNPVMYDAITSSEDKNFYTHGGVDLVGTVSALVGNASNGSNRGGSSITQQYVKNVLQQNCESKAKSNDEVEACFTSTTVNSGSEGYQRKLQEMRYAIQLEKAYSKERSSSGTSTSRTSAARSTASAPPPALLDGCREPDDRAGRDDRRHGAGAEHLPHRPPGRVDRG
jgi:membrane peptidoglycan carboxypeptidase